MTEKGGTEKCDDVAADLNLSLYAGSVAEEFEKKQVVTTIDNCYDVTSIKGSNAPYTGWQSLGYVIVLKCGVMEPQRGCDDIFGALVSK